MTSIAERSVQRTLAPRHATYTDEVRRLIASCLAVSERTGNFDPRVSDILAEAGLSFLGLGDPNLMSWGMMIGSSRQYVLSSWWAVAIPGAAIFLTVLAVSLIGDGLNDALNPKLRER